MTETPQAQILKNKHSMLGKSMVPVIAKLKTWDPDSDTMELSRLKKGHPLEDYGIVQLRTEFEKLTGESVKDILILVGLEENIKTVRQLLHLTILQANLVGMPAGQPLTHISEPDVQPKVPASGTSVTPGAGAGASGNLGSSQELNPSNCKKGRFSPDIPDWEFSCGFMPKEMCGKITERPIWVNSYGETTQPSSELVTAEEVAKGKPFNFEHLSFRDPNTFMAGSLCNNTEAWDEINAPCEILNWLKNGVDIHPMFKHFSGNFKGKCYNSSLPPSVYFPNAKNCEKHGKFIADTLMTRILNGSISIIGKVGECEPPHLVMPITMEPSLDTLKDVPRIVSLNSYMASLDDKSGYDHILLHPNSRTFFGLQFGGWFMVFNSIPFGFKGSAFIYHTIGLVAMSHCRVLGVPVLLYIDDRLISEWKGDCLQTQDPYNLALKSLYIVCHVLIRLGYFLNLSKCVLIPTQCLKFLGMLCNSVRMSFILPEDKKISFAKLREEILQNNEVAIKTLQRFAGKCISFVLAIPGARLYSREVNKAIGLAAKNSRPARLTSALRQEISRWRFLDDWTGCAPWREEKHFQVVLASDASLFKWGSYLIDSSGAQQEFGDFWMGPQDKNQPIHVKEAFALLNSLKSVKSQLEDHRVDAFCDNMAVVQAWENQGGRDSSLNSVLKEIFEFTFKSNVNLHVHYTASAENPADKESRRLSKADVKLSRMHWKIVEDRFGPHTVDLMALDSNVMLDSTGSCLKHYTPFPSTFSSGVNVFSQDVSKEINPYVFPPLHLIFPVFTHLLQCKVHCCTMIIPSLFPRPVWWPLLWAYVKEWDILARKGDLDVVLFPSRKGYVSDLKGLTFDLFMVNVPRMWHPPERCNVCNHINDLGFKFCQSCGQENQKCPDALEVDDYLVERRLSYLNNLISDSSYNRKKSALEKQFEYFLKSFGKNMLTATPKDVTKYLVSKDDKGKTQIHVLKCKNLGKLGFYNCGCPCRLAAGTVKSYLGQLKSIFELNGRGKDWNDATDSGNPASSLITSNYVKAIQLEQAKSHVQKKQAKPLFLSKLRAVSNFLNENLKMKSLPLSERYVMLRDQAFFKVQYFSGDRAHDLSLVLVQEMRRFKDNSGVIFSHTVGKTLGNGKVNEFSIMRMDDHVICPVLALEKYIEGVKCFGISLDTGYLFRTLDFNRTVVLDDPVSSSVMHNRLKKYLVKLDLYEGETPHGIRGACAITLALSGLNKNEIMDHIGWATDTSYKRYSRISKIVGQGSVSSVMKAVAQNHCDVESIFESINTKDEFTA